MLLFFPTRKKIYYPLTPQRTKKVHQAILHHSVPPSSTEKYVSYSCFPLSAGLVVRLCYLGEVRSVFWKC